jgi:hypothetical protein
VSAFATGRRNSRRYLNEWFCRGMLAGGAITLGRSSEPRLPGFPGVRLHELVSLTWRVLMSVPGLQMFHRSFLSKWLDRGQRKAQPARKPRQFRPALESLEGRELLSTLTVTSAADHGSGTLRQAIALANSGDTITAPRQLWTTSSASRNLCAHLTPPGTS